MRHGVASALLAAFLFPTATPTAQGPAPARATDGKPNLQGVWQVLTTASWDVQDHQPRLGVPAGQGIVDGNDIPYLPAVLAKKRANFENSRRLIPRPRGICPVCCASCTCRFHFKSSKRPIRSWSYSNTITLAICDL